MHGMFEMSGQGFKLAEVTAYRSWTAERSKREMLIVYLTGGHRLKFSDRDAEDTLRQIREYYGRLSTGGWNEMPELR